MKLAMCVASSTRTRPPSEGTPSAYERSSHDKDHDSTNLEISLFYFHSL